LRTPRWEQSPTAGPEYELPRDLRGQFLTLMQQDRIMRRIDDRIGRHTGVKPHNMEDPFALARVTTLGNATRGGYYAPYGLHHDADTRCVHAFIMCACV
jgi:hypothetical protein